MTNLHQRLAKLEALTEARGATPAEASQARELAAKLRQKIRAESPQPWWHIQNIDQAAIDRFWQRFYESGRRIVSPAWDPALQGKVFK